jgi:hypothetical protein
MKNRKNAKKKPFCQRNFNQVFKKVDKSNYVSQIILIFLAKTIFHLKIADIALISISQNWGFQGIQASK